MQAFTFVVLAMVAGICAATSQVPADAINTIPAGSRPTGFYYAVQTYDNTPAQPRNVIPANNGYINPYALNYGYPGMGLGMQYGYPSNWFLNSNYGYNPYYANPYMYNGYNGILPAAPTATQA